MTSLKNVHANEIAENLAKLLGDDGFMQIHRKASLNVEATPQNLQQFLTGLAQTAKAEDAYALLRKYVDGKTSDGQPYLSPQEAAQAERATRDHVGKLKQSEIQTVPKGQFADDEEEQDAADGCQHAADATCQQCGDAGMMADDEDEQDANDPALTLAVNFAINHLVKVADALDGNGFAGVANMVDETIQALAKKKSDKEEDDDKKSKKSKKDEEDKKESKKESKKSEKDDKEKK
jgi:hypothetical protein